MASQDHRTPPDTTPPRHLGRIGLIALVAAIAVAAFGIMQRRSNEAEVAQWTQEQSIPTVAVITPRPGAAVQHLVLPGTVQAWYEAPIYARVNQRMAVSLPEKNFEEAGDTLSIANGQTAAEGAP